MSDIFISYANEDLEQIRPLIHALENTGRSVFWDRTIPAGRTWRQVIGTEIDTCSCMLVVWSKHSVESDWVQEEADEGKRRGALVPVLIDDVLPPIGFRAIQAAKLGGWDSNSPSDAFDRLLTDLSNLLGNPPAQSEQEAKKKAGQEAAERVGAEAEQMRKTKVERAEVARKERAAREQAEQEAALTPQKAQRHMKSEPAVTRSSTPAPTPKAPVAKVESPADELANPSPEFDVSTVTKVIGKIAVVWIVATLLINLIIFGSGQWSLYDYFFTY